MREIAFSGPICFHPLLEHAFFEAPHGFHFGDAGVRHAVHVPVEEGLLVGRSEVAVMRDALVVVVGHEIEDVLFQVRSSAGNDADLVPPDHFGEGKTEFACAHGAGQRDEHFAAAVDQLAVAVGRINQRSGVEVAVMVAG